MIYIGALQCCTLLIENGANFDARNSSGFTAYQLAALNESTEDCAEYLLLKCEQLMREEEGKLELLAALQKEEQEKLLAEKRKAVKQRRKMKKRAKQKEREKEKKEREEKEQREKVVPTTRRQEKRELRKQRVNQDTQSSESLLSQEKLEKEESAIENQLHELLSFDKHAHQGRLL